MRDSVSVQAAIHDYRGAFPKKGPIPARTLGAELERLCVAMLGIESPVDETSRAFDGFDAVHADKVKGLYRKSLEAIDLFEGVSHPTASDRVDLSEELMKIGGKLARAADKANGTGPGHSLPYNP
jgi:hypothetical protein